MHWLDAGQHIDEPDEWQTYADYYLEIYNPITGVHLDPALVSKGRTEEMTFFKQQGAYKHDTISNCEAATGKPPVPTGWVDVNKGDVTTPLVRCRWVIKETRHKTSMDTSDPSQTFSTTPPYEALRCLISMTMTPLDKSEDDFVLMFIDNSSASSCEDATGSLGGTSRGGSQVRAS